ncbi:uncharacterized protein LOC117651863 [Thrips palmi]|uniref:Uncharacterized protein LOC117651863 n=1 Tax=Thrips palmi TaxID=161013 RepID=A0A6P9A481_THRPL|nr:uncharacterized protein LOC117651863 [Thrips palmi]
MEMCPPEKQSKPFFFHFRVAHDRKRPSFVRGAMNMTTSYIFDDNTDIAIEMASWSSRGGWKDNAFKIRLKRACFTAPQYLPTVYNTLKATLFGETQCPWPPGAYYHPNVSMEIRFTLPVFYYGKYRADLGFTDHATNEMEACVRATIKVVPKTR